MNYQSIPNWIRLPDLRSSSKQKCSRCQRVGVEAGVVEAYTIFGEGCWVICEACLDAFLTFVSMDGGETMDDVVITYGLNDDVDVAEHHMFCGCIECRIFDGQYDGGFDADDQVKFWKENSSRDVRDERLTA